MAGLHAALACFTSRRLKRSFAQALGERADRFFDHRLQLKQAMGFLFARDKNFEVEFMDDVVGDLPREIDRYRPYKYV
jgi:hypothetical protein